jgi:hypothetical protein
LHCRITSTELTGRNTAALSARRGVGRAALRVEDVFSKMSRDRRISELLHRGFPTLRSCTALTIP